MKIAKRQNGSAKIQDTMISMFQLEERVLFDGEDTVFMDVYKLCWVSTLLVEQLNKIKNVRMMATEANTTTIPVIDRILSSGVVSSSDSSWILRFRDESTRKQADNFISRFSLLPPKAPYLHEFSFWGSMFLSFFENGNDLLRHKKRLSMDIPFFRY